MEAVLRRITAALLLLLLPPGPAAAAPPAQGLFLVATENLARSSFRDTVVLITHHSRMGTMGLALNRPTRVPLREYLPDVEALKDSDEVLFLGGPVRPRSLFVLFKTRRPHAGMHHVAGDVYFAAGAGALRHGLPRATAEERARAYAGYAGWGPGQLEAEIARGDWKVVRGDPGLAFVEDPQTIRARLLAAQGEGRWI